MKKDDRVRITNSFFVDDFEYIKKGDIGTITRRVPRREKTCGDFIVAIDRYKGGSFHSWNLRKQNLELIR